MTDADLSTDRAWEEWGRRDPYFGVITCPQFRRGKIDATAREEFFASGNSHVDYLFQVIRQFIDPGFAPRSVLDFGCGVGRLVIPFARLAGEVVGLDVSSAMLAEARANCAELGVGNVDLLLSDDTLSAVDRKFDLVHSFIVFQHIPPERGREIFRHLLDRLAPGGVGAVHFTYSKSIYADWHGVAPPAPPPPPGAAVAQVVELPPGVDPEMQMNPYDLRELLFLVQNAGVLRFHVDFTDHGGELGVVLYFRKPDA